MSQYIHSIFNISWKLVSKLCFYMLLFKKFNHVSIIRTYVMIFEWEFFGTYLCYVRSYKLITNNKRFDVRPYIYQRNSEFYTQILILLKPLRHVHLRSDPMVMQQICMYITLYVKNVSIIYQYISILINFSQLYFNKLFNRNKDFLQCHKNLTNFLFRLIQKAAT